MDVLGPREPMSTWSHGAGLILALFGILLLWRRSGGAPGTRLSLMVYGASLAACYAASTLYHGLDLPPERLAAFDRLDRIGIFLLIAGSYTPLAWGLLRGRWRWGTLASVWLVAAVATILLATGRTLATPLATGLYLGMGWGSIACYGQLARVVSHRALRPLLLGGVFYSVGAVLNLIGWPALRPGHFEAHELFHLFVLAGSLAHFRLMLRVVAPFGNGSGAVPHGSGRGWSSRPDTCRA